MRWANLRFSAIGFAAFALCLAQPSKPIGSPAEESSLRQFILDFTKDDRLDDGTLRYYHAFVDLNDDGEDEAIVQLIGRTWCGSGGCQTLVLAPNGQSFRVVSEISLVHLPIRAFPESSHGWHDLGVFVSGGGIQPGYEAALRFDGKGYPENPSVPPAIEIKEHRRGEVLISESAQSISLEAPVTPRPSYDCGKASSLTEKLICQNADLALSDRAMAAVYQAALQRLPQEKKALLRSEQSAWFREYSETCNATTTDDARKTCIRQHLSSRTRQLMAVR